MRNDKIKESHGRKHEYCDFGMKKFNLKKDNKKYPPEEIPNRNRPTKPPKYDPGTGGGGGGTVAPGGGGVIYLDFTGHIVSGTPWNVSGDIMCTPANLSAIQVDEILNNVIEDYALYNIHVTTDEAVFNAAPINKRMRCILTETWEWYGQAGGVAFLGSYSWGDNTPCFVFTSLLGYNVKYIKEAVSHEIGHTLGLYHQATYQTDCSLLSAYNYGCCGEAPVMGVGYYQPYVHWWVGPDSRGCNSIIDEHAFLVNFLGLK